MTLQEKRKEANAIIRKLKEQKRPCANCGSKESIDYHHVVPLCNGGSNALSNFIPLCEKCHNAAHGKAWTKNRGKRKPKPPPEGYEEVLEAYFLNRIGKQELMEVLGLKDKRITQIWWVKKYREENSYWIPDNFYNHVDILAAKAKRKPNNIGRVIQIDVPVREMPSKEEMKRWIDDMEKKIGKMPYTHLGSGYTSESAEGINHICPSNAVEAPNLRSEGVDDELPFSDFEAQE